MRTPIDEFVYRYGGTFVYHEGQPWYVSGHVERDHYDEEEPIDFDVEVSLEAPGGSPLRPRAPRIHVPFDEIDTSLPQPGYYYIQGCDSIGAVTYNPTRRYKRGFDLECLRLIDGPGWSTHYMALKGLWDFHPTPKVPSREIAIIDTAVYMYGNILGLLNDDTVEFNVRIKREMRHYLKEVLHATGYKTVWNKPGQ